MPLATILSKDRTAPCHIFTFKCQHLATCSISAHATWLVSIGNVAYISRYQGLRHCPLGLSEACHTESSAHPSSRSLPEVKTATIINHPYIHHLGFVDRFVGSCIRLGVPDQPREIIELNGLCHIFFTVGLKRSQEVMLFRPYRNCCGMSLSSLLPSSLCFPFLFLLLLLLLHLCLLIHYSQL